MNKQAVLFHDTDGGVRIFHPTSEALALLPIHTLAQQIVPHGQPFLIEDIENLPLDGTLNEHGVPNIDKTFRAAFEIPVEELTSGVGAEFNSFGITEKGVIVGVYSSPEGGMTPLVEVGQLPPEAVGE